MQSALPLHTHILQLQLLLSSPSAVFRHVADKCSDPDTPILIGIRPAGRSPAAARQNSVHEKTAGLSIRQYLLWKIAHASLTAAVMAVLTGVLRFSIF